ncbi:hypothetical protein TEA_022606 [Camellia sinensis var. sinensis]|uniref:PB1 domain-containing protein n=1 Tax=Camellia sinensis var. sinensis TaxID=542762 RepID=A0A4S4DL45_CAMSN|nr:hypothetical protein TEA_022606 [Camellia sinensis var. sinensis]
MFPISLAIILQFLGRSNPKMGLEKDSIGYDIESVSKSTLKRACREYGIDRWPRRNIYKSGCSQTNEWAPCVNLEQSSQLNLDDLPFAQPSASIVHTEPHDTTMQDANVVTIKEKYAEGNAIKFRLSLSSRLIELQQEVAERLNLEAGTFHVKYKDEDGDLILIACDGDLRDYMCVSRLEGKTCVVNRIEIFLTEELFGYALKNLGKARNNIVADLNGESQMETGVFFQCKPHAFGVPIHRNLKNKIRSTRAEDSKAQNLDI